jgi:succinyl-CoA synthetase beta subunit
MEPHASGVLSIERLLTAVRGSGRLTLTEPETKSILAMAGISVPRTQVVTNVSEALAKAQELGFPVVLKIVSPDLPHKSDAGGVRLGLDSPDALEHAYVRMLQDVRHAAPDARIDGVLVEPHLAGLEVVVGATTDPVFGPVMVFGLGGTAVEVLGDVAFRLAPLDRDEAAAMLQDIKGAALLKGFRGSAAVDENAIISALLALSDLMTHFPDVVREIEINPFLVTPQGAVAVDATAVMWPMPVS